MESGKFYELAAVPMWNGELDQVIGGIAAFWQQFQSNPLGSMIPEQWRNIVTDFVNQIPELLKPGAINDIFSM